MRSLFHIAKLEDWKEAQSKGVYECSSLKSEGFIHCSLPYQVLNVANFLFKDQSDLVILHIFQELVTSQIKYEGSETNQFPHIYGTLNLDAVIGVYNFSKNHTGFQLPIAFLLVGDTLVRPAYLGDEAEIANVHIHSWQQSYKNIIPQNYLDSLALQFHKRFNWWRKVLQGKTTTQVFIAESNQDGIIGFISLERGRDPEQSQSGEITSIYCLNEYKNKGIGSALFKMGLSTLSSQHYKKGYLWVLEKNPTCLFYERMGGSLLSNKKTINIGVPLVEIAYEWNL